MLNACQTMPNVLAWVRLTPETYTITITPQIATNLQSAAQIARADGNSTATNQIHQFP